MAGHSAVRAVVVVAGLWAVALPAQRDGVAHVDQRAVGEAKRGLISDHVARSATEAAVREHEPLMELVELGRTRR